MSNFIPWNSKLLEEWASKYARGKFIELDGLSTHYLEKGSGETVILIHGFFFDTNMWNKNIDALAKKYKLYVIDLWGFGYSTRKPLDYGYPLYTKQLLKFMNALNIERASLIGQSMGGGTIINFANLNQSRVKKIVLVNASGMPNKLPVMGRISILPRLGELLYNLNNNYVRKFTLKSTFIFNSEIITDQFFDILTRFHKIAGSTEVMLQVTRNHFFDKLSNEIKSLKTKNIPTLIVWGKEEKSIPLSVGKELASILSHSRFEILNNAGHCSNIDQFELFNQLVLDFLESN